MIPVCILYDFPCEMDFSHHETSGEKSISHGKLYKMHFLAYFTLQDTLGMLNTLRKVEDHENHGRWIYLTAVIYLGESQKYARKYGIQWKEVSPHQGLYEDRFRCAHYRYSTILTKLYLIATLNTRCFHYLVHKLFNIHSKYLVDVFSIIIFMNTLV